MRSSTELWHLHSKCQKRSRVGNILNITRVIYFLSYHIVGGYMTNSPEKIKKMKIPKEVRKEAERIGVELTKLSKDPEVLIKARQFKKEVSRLTAQDLLRQFSI